MRRAYGRDKQQPEIQHQIREITFNDKFSNHVKSPTTPFINVWSLHRTFRTPANCSIYISIIVNYIKIPMKVTFIHMSGMSMFETRSQKLYKLHESIIASGSSFPTPACFGIIWNEPVDFTLKKNLNLMNGDWKRLMAVSSMLAKYFVKMRKFFFF